MKINFIKFLTLGIFFILTNVKLTAQVSDKMNTMYEKQWNEIDSLLNQARLPKTALEKIDLLWNKSITENNESQQIKALIYWSNATQQVAENTKDTLLPVWIKSIDRAHGVQKAIMQSILA